MRGARSLNIFMHFEQTILIRSVKRCSQHSFRKSAAARLSLPRFSLRNSLNKPAFNTLDRPDFSEPILVYGKYFAAKCGAVDFKLGCQTTELNAARSSRLGCTGRININHRQYPGAGRNTCPPADPNCIPLTIYHDPAVTNARHPLRGDTRVPVRSRVASSI